MQTAIITGITGQDGTYLAELLISKGYEVHGIIRRSSHPNDDFFNGIFGNSDRKPILHYGDLTDEPFIGQLFDSVKPHEVYNLAAQSHVAVSFKSPKYTAEVNMVAVGCLLEACRCLQTKLGRPVKFYQASTSEMFGSTCPPQSETSLFHPRSPYAVAKVGAHLLCQNYRESYGMFVCCGILFNHESPRRGEDFVTRKITRALTRIKLGLQKEFGLGNLDAKRDWGFAGDYVVAMWMMLQHDKPDDYVVSSGQSHSIREFLDVAGQKLGMDWETVVRFDKTCVRPAEVDYLLGDCTKAKETLGWEPKVNFETLVDMMIEHDLQLAAQEKKRMDCVARTSIA